MARGPTLPHRMVWPSGAVWATASLPIVPPAPPRLSTRAGGRRAADDGWGRRRGVEATDSPGGKGTTSRIGFAGYCAKAPCARGSSNARQETSPPFLRRGACEAGGEVWRPPPPPAFGVPLLPREEGKKLAMLTLDPRLRNISRNPVGNITDPQRPVVDLAVLGPALLGREDPERLLLCGKRRVELVRRLHRHDAVVRPVRDQHRAGDFIRDSCQRKLLRALERGARIVQTEDPLELEIRLGAFQGIGLQLLLDPRLPGVQVPVQRAQAHAGGVAALEGGDARRVIAAEAVAHDQDFFRIDVRAPRHELVRRRARHFVVVARVDLAQAQRLTLPRPVDRERIDPSPRELQAREEHAPLLAVVHAVEEHHRGRAARGTLRLHEVRGERLALVRYLDEFDVLVPPLQSLLGAAQRLLVEVELLVARRNETLAGVVVVARAQVVVPGGEVAAFGRGLVGESFVFLRHRAPLLPPRVRVPHPARPELLRRPVYLPDRDRAVGRHALAHEGRVRPHEIAGKMVDPAALRHPCLLLRLRASIQ